MLGRIIKPENLTFNMSIYVQKDLNKFYDQPQVTSIDEVLKGS